MKPGRRRLKLIGALVLAVAVIGGLVAAAYYSPLMSVRTVQVNGTSIVDQADVLSLADVRDGTPLLQVDTAGVAGRVSRLPAVESVTVHRRYPSTLDIDVTERRPTALLDLGDDRLGVMDRLGAVYLEFGSRSEMTRAPGGKVYAALPLLAVADPGPGDPTTEAALTVVGDLPDWLRKIVTEVKASSPVDVNLALTRGRTVVWVLRKFLACRRRASWHPSHPVNSVRRNIRT